MRVLALPVALLALVACVESFGLGAARGARQLGLCSSGRRRAPLTSRWAAASSDAGAGKEEFEGGDEGVGSEAVEGDGAAEGAEGEEGGTPAAEEKEEEEEDPATKAIRELEAKLFAEVAQLESQLRNERLSLAKLKDQISESGKNGYFIVQAQVAEFLKKNEADQKGRVSRNKREFVVKMLDVVDGFRKAPLDFPGETEREINMHKNFGSIVNSVLIVFEKYGFKEISCAVGSPIDAETMEVGEAGDGAAGVILGQLRSGWIDPDGAVVRKALIVANEG